MLETPKSPVKISRHWLGGIPLLLVGGLVLAVWMPDLPGPGSLQTVTALSFALSGAALCLLQVRCRPCALAARICTGILAVIAVVTLAEDAIGWKSGIEKLLGTGISPLFDNFARGRMGPTTALSFALTAAALWLMGRPGGNHSRPLLLGWLGTLVVATGLFASLGNVSGIAGGGWWNPADAETIATPMFVLLGGGLLAVAWKQSGERWLIERRITTGFAAGLALLVAIAWFSHHSTQNLIHAAQRVKQSHEILVAAGGLRSIFQEFENRMRGYGIPDNAGSLPFPRELTAKSRKFFGKLRTLTVGHPSQQQRIDRLESRFDEGLAISRDRNELGRTTGVDAAAGEKGRELMDSIRSDLLAMEAEEQFLLQGREEESAVITDRTFALLPVGSVLSFILLASVLLRLNQEMAARQQAADSLRRSERRLRLALDAAQIGEWDLELDSHTIRRSLRHEQIFGDLGSLTDWSYGQFLERVHPEDRDRVDASFQASVAAGRDWEFECRIRRKDRVDGWIWARGTVVRDDESGRLVEMLGVVRDISGQKHIETELRLATARFQLALKNSAISVFNQDHDLRYTWIYNPSLGLDPEGILGKTDADLLERKQDAAVLEAIKREVITTGVGRHEEVTLHTQSEDRSYDLRVEPLPDATGKTAGVMCVAVDISARKQTERNVAFLAEMQSMTGPFSTPEDTLRMRGARIVEHLRLDRCLFMEISDSAGVFTVLHDHHAPDLPDHPGVCCLADFHTAEELRRMEVGEMLVMDDTRRSEFAERFAGQGIGALANAIHEVDGSWKFLLSVQRRQPQKWSPEDITLLDELARHIYLRLERARAEERLRESEARFRSIFHEAAVPMEVAMPDGRFVQVNRAFCELLGYSEDELLSLTFGLITHPDELDRLALEPLRDLIQGTIPCFRAEKRYLRKDGEVVWVDLSVSVVRDATNKPLYFIGQIQDITGRKRAEEALGKIETMLAMAIEGAQFGIWDWDILTNELYWSERRKAMSGLPADAEITYEIGTATVHPDDRQRIEDAIAHAREMKTDGQQEFRTVWPDGTVRWLHGRGRVFKDRDGNPIRYTGITIDVTEQREAEEALRRFNAELESLVRERTEVIQMTMQELRAEMAERRRLEQEILSIGEREQARIGQDLHDDLGQRLVGLSLLIQLLSGKLAVESHPAAADATRMKSLVSECLATTRNLAKSLYPVELERGGLILSLQDLAQRTEMMAGIVCTVSTGDAFRFEKSAEIHLYRIVQESVANALKHGKARHIAITCTAKDGVSTLAVTDDGTGFAPQEGMKWEGMGLHLFEYRARLIGATIEVARGETGGCRVRCLLPDQAP